MQTFVIALAIITYHQNIIQTQIQFQFQHAIFNFLLFTIRKKFQENFIKKIYFTIECFTPQASFTSFIMKSE